MMSDESPRATTALFLVDLGPIPARVVSAWCAAGHHVAELWTVDTVTQGAWKRDRRLARLAARWSVGATLRKYEIPLRRVQNLRDDIGLAEIIASLRVDVVVSVHFPRILPAALLSRLTVPAVNLHPSLLPAYRGGTPLVSMLVDDAQERFSGVTIHAMVPKVDAGAIFASQRVAFPKNASLRQWELDLARAAARLAVDTIPAIVARSVDAVEQFDETASYRSTTADELRLTPSRSLTTIDRLCATLGKVRPLEFLVGDAGYPIAGLPRHLGPPSGQPPSLGWFHIESDLADARVRFRRRPWWEGRRRRIETLLLQIRSPS